MEFSFLRGCVYVSVNFKPRLRDERNKKYRGQEDGAASPTCPTLGEVGGLKISHLCEKGNNLWKKEIKNRFGFFSMYTVDGIN